MTSAHQAVAAAVDSIQTMLDGGELSQAQLESLTSVDKPTLVALAADLLASFRLSAYSAQACEVVPDLDYSLDYAMRRARAALLGEEEPKPRFKVAEKS